MIPASRGNNCNKVNGQANQCPQHWLRIPKNENITKKEFFIFFLSIDYTIFNPITNI